MALGYGGHADWRDMSEYLVHMTDSVEALVSILRDRRIEARSAYGAVRNHQALVASQRVVCVSEIPLDHLGRLAEKHGAFGLAFPRAVLSATGATPVWYLERGSPVQQRIFQMVYDAAYLNQPPDPDHFLWKLTPFIDYPGIYGQREYRWQWEREWRMLGDLTFAPETLPFLFAPERHHQLFRLRWAETPGSGPCPALLDAAWSLEHVQVVAGRADL